MKQNILFLFLVFFSLFSIAQERAEYDGIDAIKEIKEGWLIVRLPGFEKKIAALDSLLASKELSEQARNRLERELELTLQEKAFIHEWYPVIFDTVYTFSRMAFLYTHETAGFQAGKIPARTSNGAPIDSVHLQNYFFATLHGVVGDPFRFTSKDHLNIAYPFPGSISKPGDLLLPFLAPTIPFWMATFVFEESTKRRALTHVRRVNRKLHRMYSRFY